MLDLPPHPNSNTAADFLFNNIGIILLMTLLIPSFVLHVFPLFSFFLFAGVGFADAGLAK